MRFAKLLFLSDIFNSMLYLRLLKRVVGPNPTFLDYYTDVNLKTEALCMLIFVRCKYTRRGLSEYPDYSVIASDTSDLALNSYIV